jgi:DNA-binding GntR family transcriptional regulator
VYGIQITFEAQEIETRTLAEQIAAHLREDVLAGRLAAGARLSQESLAEQFKVSRVPIRDALRQLQAEGLVVGNPRLGSTVAELSAGDLEELYDMRLALEPAVARLATPRLRASDLAAMRRHLDVMSSSGELSTEWFSAHAAFHHVLNVRSGRERMCALADSLRAQTERYLRVYRVALQRADEIGAEHELIYRTASEGDADAVAAAVDEHLVLVRDPMLAYLRSLRPDEQSSEAGAEEAA